MVEIGAELPKLYQNKTGYPFFGPPCMLKTAGAGERQRRVPPKKWLVYFTAIISCNVKMVADKHRHAAHYNKHWWWAFWIYKHRWPWTTL